MSVPVQIDIFGNDVEPKKLRLYRVYGYVSYTLGYKDIKAYSEKQAVYLFRKYHDFKVKVTDVYEVK
jgi:hypothetical protein